MSKFIRMAFTNPWDSVWIQAAGAQLGWTAIVLGIAAEVDWRAILLIAFFVAAQLYSLEAMIRERRKDTK